MMWVSPFTDEKTQGSLKEIQYLLQGHMAQKWQRGNLNPGPNGPQSHSPNAGS